MNKEQFIKELEYQLAYPKEKCVLINHVLENHFWLSKNKKEEIIMDFIETLSVSEEEALKIYEVSMNLLKEEIHNQLKHPFKSKD